MSFSALQRFILLLGHVNRKRLQKTQFFSYYDGKKNPPSRKDQHGSLDKSIERLVEKGFARAHGVRTAEKWTIEAVSLTKEGRRAAGEILKARGKLPLPKRRKKKNGRTEVLP